MENQNIEKTGLFQELIKRRLFYIVGMYLGASVALMELTGVLIERFQLSANLVDYVLIAMFSWLPGVILLAWRHGKPGKDRWGKPEAIGLPLNAAIMLMIMLSYTSQTGTEQQAANPAKQAQVAAPEPPDAPIQANAKHFRLHAFPIDINPSMPQDKRWLGYAMTTLIANRLDQHPHINVDSLLNVFNQNAIVQTLSRKGFADGFNIPKPLKQQVAQETNAGYFLSGELNQSTDQSFELNATLYNTKDGSAAKHFVIRQQNLFKLVDNLAEQLITLLQIEAPPAKYKALLSTSELVTDKLTALEPLINAQVAMKDKCFEEAQADYQKAIEQDNQFALAYLELAFAQLNSGQTEQAKRNLNRLLSLNYKTPDAINFRAQSIIYQINLDVDKMFAVLETWVEMYPQDTAALNNYAAQMQFRGSEEKALELYNKSLEIDPSQTNNLINISYLHRSLAQDQQAIDVLQSYLERYPNRYQPRHELAKIYIEQSKLELAKRQYQQSAFLHPDTVEPLLQLANIHLRMGELEEVQRYIKDASYIANAPSQKAAVLQTSQNYYSETGQVELAYQTMLEKMELQQQQDNPTNIMFNNYIGNAGIIVESGNHQQVKQNYQAHFSTIGPPLDNYIHLLDANFYLHVNELERAEQAVLRSRAFFDESKSTNTYFFQEIFEGELAYLKGNYELALNQFEKAEQGFLSSVVKAMDSDFGHLIMLRLAHTHFALNQPKLALIAIDNILKSWPYHTKANLTASAIYLQMNDQSRAQQSFEKAQQMLTNASDKSADWQHLQSLARQLSTAM